MMLRRFIYIVMCAVLAASCSTSRKSLNKTMVGGLTGTEYVEKMIEISPSRMNITAKASIDIAAGSKKRISFNSNIRIRRGEVIRFSVAPVLGIEVARIDITPDGILAIDRLHKRYVHASFDELSEIMKTDLGFNIIQSLLMNELFMPGKQGLSIDDARKFSVKTVEDKVKVVVKKTGKVDYGFLASASDGRIEETVLGLKGTDYSIQCRYDGFEELDGRPFPRKMLFSAEGLSQPYTIDMKLSRVDTDSQWDSTTQLSSKYKKIPLRELLEMLF